MQLIKVFLLVMQVASIYFSLQSVSIQRTLGTGRKLNVLKTFKRCPGRLLNVLCTFSLHPVSRVLSCLNFSRFPCLLNQTCGLQSKSTGRLMAATRKLKTLLQHLHEVLSCLLNIYAACIHSFKVIKVTPKTLY